MGLGRADHASRTIKGIDSQTWRRECTGYESDRQQTCRPRGVPRTVSANAYQGAESQQMEERIWAMQSIGKTLTRYLGKSNGVSEEMRPRSRWMSVTKTKSWPRFGPTINTSDKTPFTWAGMRTGKPRRERARAMTGKGWIDGIRRRAGTGVQRQETLLFSSFFVFILLEKDTSPFRMTSDDKRGRQAGSSKIVFLTSRFSGAGKVLYPFFFGRALP